MRTKEEILKGRDKISFMMDCLVSFKFFCEEFLGINEFGGVHSFQEDWFNALQKYDRVVIEAPSGFSKTEIMGVVYPLWLMWNNPGKTILLFSKSIKQAESNLLSRVKGYIEDNEFLRELVPTTTDRTWNKEQIKTKDKTWMINIPYNINAKSYRADYIICDEADSYEDSAIYFDIIASRPNPGGKICLISTPEGPTKLVQELKDRKPKGYKFIKTVAFVDKEGNPWIDKEGQPLPDIEKSNSLWPERFPVPDLMLKREEMGENEWQKNYFCNIMTEASDAIFSLKSWVDCYDESLSFNKNINPDAQYFIGADFAQSKGPKADLDAYVVIEKTEEFMTVKHIETWKGKMVPFKVERLKELYETYHSNKATKIIADESNVGVEVIRDLRNQGYTTQSQNFHYTHRKAMLKTLANVIEGGGIIVPRYRRDKKTMEYTNALLLQLLGFVRRKSDITAIEQFQSKAVHDDIAISLSMAVKEAAGMKSCGFIGMSA